jgi:hypothetical protein
MSIHYNSKIDGIRDRHNSHINQYKEMLNAVVHQEPHENHSTLGWHCFTMYFLVFNIFVKEFVGTAPSYPLLLSRKALN